MGSNSVAIIGVGFLIAWLGVIMVYLSLRAEPDELRRHGLGFLSGPLARAQASRRIIKFVIVIGLIVTAGLYVASWVGLIAW